MLNGSEKWEHFKDSYPFPFSIRRFPLSRHRYPIPSFASRALHSCFKGRVIWMPVHLHMRCSSLSFFILVQWLSNFGMPKNSCSWFCKQTCRHWTLWMAEEFFKVTFDSMQLLSYAQTSKSNPYVKWDSIVQNQKNLANFMRCWEHKMSAAAALSPLSTHHPSPVDFTPTV